VRDFPSHAAGSELVAGFLRVVAGVEVDGDVVRERAYSVELVQRGGQERGVVPACRGEDPAEGDARGLHRDGPLHALFSPVDGAAPGALAAAGRFRAAAVDGDVAQFQADDPVIGVPGDRVQLPEDPQFYPLIAPVPDGGGAAGAVGDRLIRAAEPADLEQFLEHDPVRDPGPMAAQRVGGVIGRPRGKKRGKLVPQRFQQP